MRSPDARESERLWIVTLGALVVVQLWFGLITTSLWLDETGTWWVVKDGAAEAARRAFYWSGQSPFFYWITWLSSRLFGLSEFSLRIPSVLAMAGAIYFLYRIAERLYDSASAAIVAFVFLCMPAVSFQAIDARPYALAMLCLTAATWELLRWMDGRRAVDALGFVIAGTLVVYAHCLMSLGLGAGIIYATVTLRDERRRLAWLGCFCVSIGLLCLPMLHQLRLFYALRSTHTLTGVPTIGEFLSSFAPGSPAGGLIFGLCICMVVLENTEVVRKWNGRSALLCGAWMLLAPVFFFLLAIFSDVRLFVPRYYSSALPGQALLAGGLLSGICSGTARKALLATLALTSVLAQGRLAVRSHGNEDWRAAMEFVKKEAGPVSPVLLVSGFVEASDFKILEDPRFREVFFAPELVYGGPARSIRLPHAFSGSDSEDLETVVRQLRNEPRFFLLTENPDQSYAMWLAGKLGPRCQLGQQAAFGYLWLTRFACETQK